MNKCHEMRSQLLSRLIAAVLLLGALARGSYAAPATYFITDLGVSEGGSYSRGHAINNKSEVVGQFENGAGYGRAFIWSAGGSGIESYSGYRGTTTSPESINDNGQTAGYSGTDGGDRAYLWTRQNFENLGTLPNGTSSHANGINNSGQVVGYSGGPDLNRAFLWTSVGGMINLGTLPGRNDSTATGINDGGQVVGYSNSGDGPHAFLWTTADGMIDLETLAGGNISLANAINNSGKVVGLSNNGEGEYAFLWTSADGMQSLGKLPNASDSTASDINDTGQVVGSSGSDVVKRAFLWTSADGMSDLNTLLDPITGFNWVLTSARGINNKGQIVGTGLHNGQERALLLTPQTPDNAPVATNGEATTEKNTPVSIYLETLVSDTSTRRPDLIYTIVAAPPDEEGALSGTEGTRTFTPAENYTGQSSFTYKVQNAGGLESETKTVTINVTAGTPPADAGGKIVFSAGSEIYVMNADGSNRTQLTNTPGYDEVPSFNVDGSKIVFSSSRDSNMEIYVMDADGSNQARLTSNGGVDSDPVFSPDGSKIAFTSDRDGNYEIWVMAADGSNPTQLTDDPAGSGAPAFSPDGSKIAFVRGNGATFDIYVMNPDGSNQALLLSDAGLSEPGPAYSPDGQRIAFIKKIDGSTEIYVMDADGGNVTRLTNSQAGNGNAAFSPDGSKIAFHSSPDNTVDTTEIYTMNADGSDQTRLTNNTNGDLYPSWAPGYVPTNANDDSANVLENSGENAIDVLANDGDPHGDTLSISAVTQGNRGSVAITGNGAGLTYTPNANTYGPDSFTYTISDGHGHTTSAAVSIFIKITDSIGNGGGKIAFTSLRDGNDAEIYVMNADGSNQTRLTISPGADVEPSFTSDGSKITFTSERDGNNEIYVMDADGSNQTRLTNNEDNDHEPAFSPDGSKIAFVSTRDGKSEIYLMDADGTNQIRLTNDREVDSSPAFSPDGSKIVSAFTLFYDENNHSQGHDQGIRVMSVDGSSLGRLTFYDILFSFELQEEDLGPAFSPNGSKIAFFSKPRDNNGIHEIYTMDANGINKVRLTDNAFFDGYPSFSSDGSKIAFQSERTGRDDIFVMNADGTDQISLTDASDGDYDPSWAPGYVPPPGETPPGDAGGKIAFTSNRDGNSEIYVMNADGSNQTRLTDNAARDHDPSFNSDGSKITFVSDRDGNNEIYVMDADGSNQTRLTDAAQRDIQPAFSADGGKIAFVSERDNQDIDFGGKIYIMNADGSNQVRLTASGTNETPAFSPDGNTIAFYSHRDGRAEIYRMDADGNNVVRLTNSDGPTSNYYPAFSPDGSKIVFTRDWQIYVMNADGSDISRLTNHPEADLEPVFSPGGGKIAFTSERDIGQQSPEIYVMNADGSNQARLTNNTAADNQPSWAPGYVPAPVQNPIAAADSETLDEDSGANALDVLYNDSPAADGDELTITDATQPPNGIVDIAPDGKSLFYTPDENFNGDDSFEYTISDGNGGSATAIVSITVGPIADAPILDEIGEQVVGAGSTLGFIATATDADGDGLSFSLEGAPAGASIDPETGDFEWKPTQAQQGHEYSFTVRVTDDSEDELSDEEEITVTVTPNTPPVLGPTPDLTGNEGELISFIVTAADGDSGQALTLSATGLPAGATFKAATGTFSWTPNEGQGPGVYNVTFTVSDGAGGTDSRIVKITVLEVNLAPSLDAIGDKDVDEGALLSFTASASDADLPANTLTYSGENLPTGASFNATTRVFSWTPSEAQGGAEHTFKIKVSDNGTPVLSDEESITVTVNKANQSPTLDSISDKTGNEGSPLSLTVGAADGDLPAQTLTYSLVGAPVGASIGGASGAFTWTPTEAQGPGVYNFKVQVSDGTTNTEQPVKVTVNEVNTAPVLPAIGSKSVNEGSSLSFTLSAATDSDVPANTLTYSATGLPTGATFNTSTRAFSWTPTEAQGPGTYSVTFKVSDGTATTQQVVAITVNEINQAPVLAAIGGKTVNEGSNLAFTLSAAADSDLPANALTYSATGLPSGATFNPATRAFSWTPSETQGSSTYNVTFKVSDGPSSDQETVAIKVNKVNAPPVLTPIDNRAFDEETSLTFALSASDPDLPANTLTYSATGLPTGATFNASTRAFSWKPTEAQGPGTYSVTFKVSDGPSSDQETVTLTVREANRAPVLAAIAARNVVGGKPLTFTASATDPDRPNQTLTYSLVNSNIAFSINPQTGVVSGTPPSSPDAYSISLNVRVTDSGSPALSDTKTAVINVSAPPVVWVSSATWSATEGTLTYLLRNRSGQNLSNVSVQGIVRTAVLGITRTAGTTSTQAQSGGRTLVKWSGFALANGASATLTIRAARPAGSGTPVADAFSLAFTASGLTQPLSSLPVLTP
jgi:probable HAF family extracellular repeat protein